GRGNIRYSPNIAGAPEADAAFQAYPKAAGWPQDLKAICQARQQSIAKTVDRLSRLLDDPAQDQRNASSTDPAQMLYVLGQLGAYQGHMDEMIRRWEGAYKNVPKENTETALQLEEALGVAYLHKSEMENGVYTKPGERCTIPPAKNGAYE